MNEITSRSAFFLIHTRAWGVTSLILLKGQRMNLNIMNVHDLALFTESMEDEFEGVEKD